MCFYLIEYHICQEKGKKKGAPFGAPYISMSVQPSIHLSLSQALNILTGMLRSLAATVIQEVQALGSLEQDLLVAGRITVEAVSTLLDQSSSLAVVLLLANDLLHGKCLLS